MLKNYFKMCCVVILLLPSINSIACDQTSVTVISSYSPPGVTPVEYIYTVEVCLGISPNWGETTSFALEPTYDAGCASGTISNLATTSISSTYNYCSTTLSFNGQGCAISAMGAGPAGGTVQTANPTGTGSIGGGGSNISFTSGGGGDPLGPDDLVADCADCNNASQVCYTITFTTLNCPLTGLQLTGAEGNNTTCPNEIVNPPVPPTCSPATTTAVASPLTVCEGDLIDLSSTCTGCTGSTVYTWSGPGGYSDATDNPTAFVTSQNSGGTYSFSADNTPCLAIPSSVVVVVTPLPRAVLGTSSLKDCNSNDVPISFTGTGPFDVTYLVDGVPTSVTGIVANPYYVNVPTNSTLTLQASSVSDAGGCGTGITSGTTIAQVTTVDSDAGNDLNVVDGVIYTLAATGTSGLSDNDTTYTANPLTDNTSSTISDAGSVISATDITLTGVTTNCPMDINNVPTDNSGVCFSYSHSKAATMSATICYPSGSGNCITIAAGSLPACTSTKTGTGPSATYSYSTETYCVPYGDLLTLFDGQTCGDDLGLTLTAPALKGNIPTYTAGYTPSFVGWSTNIQDMETNPLPNPTYVWTAYTGSANTTLLSCTTCEDPDFTAPATGGCFILTVTDAFGCIAYDTMCYNISLSVDDLDFNTIVNESEVELEWNKLSEESIFIVERSLDGNNFKAISNEIINSESKDKIQFTDDKPLLKAYYRLKIINDENFEEYSITRYVELEITNKFRIENMYPMPAYNILNVDIYSGNESNITIKLIDLTSRVVFFEEKVIHQGNTSINLNMGEYDKGTYMIIVSDGNKVIRSKIIKE